MSEVLRADGAPQYVIHAPLGVGGTAIVYLGTMVTPAGRRRVAIKRVLARDESSREATDRLVAEARLVFPLVHPNICQVLDLGTSHEGTFIVMEFVDGLDLKTLLDRLCARGRRLEVPSAVHIVREVARALDSAHRQTDESGHPLRLVHGDVAPQNILLSREGAVKLGDFGIARALGVLAPGNRLRGGTPGFVAPEVLEGGGDQRADVYSLGATLYAALTGRSPAHVAALREECPEIGGELAATVDHALAKAPELRFPTASEIERVLGLYLARRFPTFHPSTLAQVVQQFLVVPKEEAGADGPTLTSLTGTDAITRLDRRANGNIETRGETPTSTRWHWRRRSGTRTLHTKEPRSLKLYGAIGLGVALLGIAWVTLGRSPASSARPQAVPWTDAPTRRSDAALRPEPSLPSPSRSSPPKRNVPAPRKRTSEIGFLSVHSVPWGIVYVDGKRVADQTPAYRVPVTAGPHRVAVFNPDRRRLSPAKQVSVRARETETVGFRW